MDRSPEKNPAGKSYDLYNQQGYAGGNITENTGGNVGENSGKSQTSRVQRVRFNLKPLHHILPARQTAVRSRAIYFHPHSHFSRNLIINLPLSGDFHTANNF
ncbi:MAG TPA: hypothetical protein DEQ30_00320 [Porphyromonadaceae bacterium]|nr:hypothetical protein [Porphyromonadaceae bacterium]